jgi:hypothetical protein
MCRRVALVAQLLLTSNVFLSSLIPSTLMMEAIRSPDSSVLTRATWRNIPEDIILHSHRRENLKSYTSFTSTVNLHLDAAETMHMQQYARNVRQFKLFHLMKFNEAICEDF